MTEPRLVPGVGVTRGGPVGCGGVRWVVLGPPESLVLEIVPAHGEQGQGDKGEDCCEGVGSNREDAHDRTDEGPYPAFTLDGEHRTDETAKRENDGYDLDGYQDHDELAEPGIEAVLDKDYIDDGREGGQAERDDEEDPRNDPELQVDTGILILSAAINTFQSGDLASRPGPATEGYPNRVGGRPPYGWGSSGGLGGTSAGGDW